ncbi:proteoglycan 3 [Turdus rufiventris]|nr:proteoglycan 3 [Turdus rufiventris]
MRPYLLLALALLGTVPVSRSALASPAVEDEEDVTELEVPEEYSGCLGANDKQAPDVPSVPGTGTCRYVIIRRCRTFHRAQCICARRFRGRLASIHNYGTNALLLHLARRHTNSGQVWIGGRWRSVRCNRRLPFICQI